MDIEQLIENKNIKLTSARKEIISALQKFNKPVSYEDIKKQISMDKATFYRNITLFEENHIVYSFEGNNKRRYFELLKQQHAHFICKVCKNIECIDDAKYELKNYVIEDISIKGICGSCHSLNLLKSNS